MSGIAKAALAAALLNCGLLTASAESSSNTGQWLKDGDCALFSAGAGSGDSVRWTGACVDGYAEGLGTATFTHDGQSQSFTANFVHGVVPNGHIITRWGQGWSYDGETVDGRFNGAGILTTDASDRFEGQWTNGKMNGFGILRRANGERYAGDWKDDEPNGRGELRRPDGSLIAGIFVDGKLVQDDAAAAPAKAAINTPNPSRAPFGSVSGKTLIGVDGSSIALTLIEGGMELQVVPTEGTARKTTFTFMTERMGTVVEDSGRPSQGSSVTGFFRLTGTGVEIRYSDGRSAMLSANPDGGVQMALEGDSGPSCNAWYPAGHSFSDAEKKVALNAYATKLGLPVFASSSDACAASPQAASLGAKTGTATTAQASPPIKAKPERRVQAAKPPAHVAKASYHIGDYQPGFSAKTLETVAVKPSQVHLIDGAAADAAAKQMASIEVPPIPGGLPERQPLRQADNEASDCLKVDSDGSHWGFRNSCDFAVQFSYCMAGGGDSLTACGDKDMVTTSAIGSVAARGFGALMSDTSLQEKDAPHNFRWIACNGGAGEVVAHLDHSDPPAGRCERAHSAAN